MKKSWVGIKNETQFFKGKVVNFTRFRDEK